MAKLTISRLFETSKVLTTEAGQQMQDFIQYMTDLAEQVIRNLRNGLTFQENFNSQVSTVSVIHNIIQTVNTSGKVPTGIFVIRSDSSLNALDFFTWFLDSRGNVAIKVGFQGAPTKAINVTLVILF